jgi:hypothetical protein
MKRAALAGLPAVLLLAGVSWAEPAAVGEGEPLPVPGRGKTDTSYGRIEGDVGIVAGVGATVASRGPRAAFDARVRYLDTAGLFVTYEDGAILGSASEPRRALAGGFELRPLFLARWLKGGELGWNRVDLAIDSLGLELGVTLSQPVGAGFASRPGLQAGLGLELPILGRASGPWIGLHGGARWSDKAIEGQPIADASDRGLFLSITIAYHQIFVAHAVDVGDRAPR